MTNREKRIVKQNLDEVYELLKTFEDSKIRNSTHYKIIFLLENINLQLEIPFED